MSMSSPEQRLEEIIRQGESEMREFRRSFGKEALRTLCAFANTKGGEVWIGIADDGTIVGTDVEGNHAGLGAPYLTGTGIERAS